MITKKKGIQLNQAFGAVLAVVLIAVLVIIAIFLFDSLGTSFDSGTAAANATDEMITQFGNYPALIGLVGTIVFLGLVIGVLVASFVFGGRGLEYKSRLIVKLGPLETWPINRILNF